MPPLLVWAISRQVSNKIPTVPTSAKNDADASTAEFTDAGDVAAAEPADGFTFNEAEDRAFMQRTSALACVLVALS